MEQNNKQTMPCFELGNLYVFKEEDENALLLCTGHVGDFILCIPYKGNENMAFTTAPF